MMRGAMAHVSDEIWVFGKFYQVVCQILDHLSGTGDRDFDTGVVVHNHTRAATVGDDGDASC